MTISEEIRSELKQKGASIVGYADLSSLPEKDRKGYPYGIIIGVALIPEIVSGIRSGPTLQYYEEYKRVNTMLNELGEYTEALLKGKGFEALAKTKKVVEIDEGTIRTELPHKTVATRAGIGWIGKCALLVTEEYGSAIRITSILTNAVLDTGTPINNSRCGGCLICKNICPAGAVSGDIWDLNKDRDEFYNAFDCRNTARERSGRIGLNESLCGLCILACPWTQRYLKKGVYSVIVGLELLPLVKPLWEGLREHHGKISKDFSESIRQRSFEERVADFEGKASNHIFRIELIKVNDSHTPIGYCISSVNDELVGEVESIFIEDTYRGLHIGDTLMKSALKWMDEHGVKTKRINVAAGNDVLRFYEKYGFKVRSHILEQINLD